MFVFNASDDLNTQRNQANALWLSCAAHLKTHIPSTQFDLWLSAIDAESLLLVGQSSTTESPRLLFHCQTAQAQKINATLSQFQATIEAYCQKVCGYPVEWLLNPINNKLTTNAQPSTTTSSQAAVQTTRDVPPEVIPVGPVINLSTSPSESSMPGEALLLEVDSSDLFQAPDTHQATGLNKRLSFDNFVVGKANQMAHAAAQHVAANPGQSYNPFFLYGGVGLGKTHLVHAVGNAVLHSRPNARIRYIHANQFIADVVASYRHQRFDAFKNYYHGLDVLLIDDIQFFADKKRTQEELFYAFEALVANHSQIILTSDTYPKDLADIESRLVSRFSAGLITAIDPPELEMRVAILQEKAKSLSIGLQEDVAFYIAKNLRSNVRELEGALHKLLAYSRFQNSHITLEMAKVALRDVISGPRGVLSVEHIQKVVADYYKVKVSDLYGKRRLASIVLPRQVAMYLTKELTQKSLPDIGESFGGRDHTTVLHAVRKIHAEKNENTQLNHQLHVLQQILGG